jgi:hypothetical protein
MLPKLCILLISFISLAANADTIDQTPRTVLDVRTYANGSLVLRVSPATTGTGCSYQDTLQMSANSPALRNTTSMVLLAYSTRRKIQFIWNNACFGNVAITGIMLPDQ